MKQAIDLFPIIVFAVAFYIYRDLILVTKFLIAATFAQVLLSQLLFKSVEKIHLMTFGVVLIFGGATLLFQDDSFVKWKPTVTSWIFACVLLVSQFILKKNLIEMLLGTLLNTIAHKTLTGKDTSEGDAKEPEFVLSVPDSLWFKLNMAWILFFIATGVTNLYVAYNFNNDIWVSFKIIGLSIANTTFLLVQMFFLFKYLPKENN